MFLFVSFSFHFSSPSSLHNKSEKQQHMKRFRLKKKANVIQIHSSYLQKVPYILDTSDGSRCQQLENLKTLRQFDH